MLSTSTTTTIRATSSGFSLNSEGNEHILRDRTRERGEVEDGDGDGDGDEGYYGRLTEEDTSQTSSTSTTTLSGWKRRLVEYLIALLVVTFMVTSAELSQWLQVDLGFQKPYFLIWFGTIWLLLCIPFQVVHLLIELYLFLPREQLRSDNLVDPQQQQRDLSVLRKERARSIWIYTRRKYLELVWLTIPFAILWFSANYLYVRGLALTTVASSLSIEQAATIFVFVLSVIALGEKVTILKTISVVVSIAGVILIAFGDKSSEKSAASSSSSSNPVLGDILVVGSAVCTALYMVLYKKSLKEMHFREFNIYLSLVGFWNVFLFWPGLLILNKLGEESLALPATAEASWVLVVGALTGLCFNYLLNFGILYTSPLFMRVAQLCSIPSSFGIALIADPSIIGWMQAVGALTIILGFVLFSIRFDRAEEQKE